MLKITPAWRTHIHRWETTLRAAGRPISTRQLRTYHLRRFAVDHSTVQLRHITDDHLLNWLATYKWAPETRRNYRSSLRLFFSWAHSAGLIATNPSHCLPTVRPSRAVPRPTPDQIVRSALMVADDRTRAAIVLIAATGMRRAEAAQTNTHALEGAPGAYQIRVVGKGGHVRLLPVSDRIAHLVLDTADDDGFLFPGRIDGHISPAYLGKLISAALGPGWTAHTLRHRYASTAYSVDRDLRAVQELLGHSSVATTQIYTAVPDDARRRAAAAAELETIFRVA